MRLTRSAECCILRIVNPIATPYAEYIGKRIKESRKAAGLSHDRLAEAIGKGGTGARSHLIKLEQGKHLPQTETLEAIAEATGRPVVWFLPAIGRRYQAPRKAAA